MNKYINLVEILKNVPNGTLLYSTIGGEVELKSVSENPDSLYPIVVQGFNGYDYEVTKNGHYYNDEYGECILFPSKDQRDWSKFNVRKSKFDLKTLKPFDKVLVCDDLDDIWRASIFSHIYDNKSIVTTSSIWLYCIPYNDETKHLVGTYNEAPEYYRYWED